MSNLLEDPEYYNYPTDTAGAELGKIGKWVEVVIILELFVVGPMLDIFGRRKLIIPS